MKKVLSRHDFLNKKREGVKTMKKLSAVFTFIGALGLVGSAYAQPIELVTSQVSKLKFVNYERWIDTNQNAKFDTGDKFEGILNVESITNKTGSIDLSAQLNNKELTGVFQISITGGLIIPPFIGGLGTGHLDFGMGAGDYIELYVGQGATKNWDPGQANAMTRASDGALWAAIYGTTGFGYEGLNDTGTLGGQVLSQNRNWADLDINNTGYTIEKRLYSNTTASEPSFHYLDFLTNDGIYNPILDVTHNFDHLVQVYFASRLFEDASVPGWQFRSEDPVYVWASAIPEPSTFILLGAGLFGMGLAARRRITKN